MAFTLVVEVLVSMARQRLRVSCRYRGCRLAGTRASVSFSSMPLGRVRLKRRQSKGPVAERCFVRRSLKAGSCKVFCKNGTLSRAHESMRGNATDSNHSPQLSVSYSLDDSQEALPKHPFFNKS